MQERLHGCRWLLIAAALTSLTAPLQTRAENQFSIYTGTSYTRNSDLRIRQGSATELTIEDVKWDAKPWKAAPYYGLRYTRFLESYPNWGIALDYTHYKMYAQTDRVVPVNGRWNGAAISESAPMNRYVQQFEISHGVNVLSLNGIYRWREQGYLNGRLQPYVGAGVAYYRPHSENQVNNLYYETGYDPSGIGYQLLGGVQYRLGSDWALFAEVKFNSGTAKVGVADGRAETPLRTFHAIGGLQYNF